MAGWGCYWRGMRPAQAALPVYTDHLVNGFQDWSWGTRDSGIPRRSTPGLVPSPPAWRPGRPFRSGSQDFNASLYANFTFWANGGTNGGQRLRVYAQYGTNSGATYQLPTPLAGECLAAVSRPVQCVGSSQRQQPHRIRLQPTGAATTATFYVDDIQLTAAPAPACRT